MAGQWIQDAIVGLVVACAVLYLLRKYLPRRRKAAGRGSCGNCSGGKCH
ncbi:Virus attachment protein p12 family protein [Azotobacter beijerinckii]|uniref:Virus attachment protein p12 family protein n=1 Tax=Azotobacter beijerinckii TaxID=170623 RepID=A0A1I4FNX4_9GAMM|nr:FeoB-associated Cys-rich membrane protein [Azotobacter beijerinckii]MDV7210504.1 FeoB-associated Cys-rich membrane protein [Azotobacter beijerinckii]SEJ18170.1 Virus attachment protein p12 family protein [Azotobacter beijerinckii]SEJ45176.1 Virus attachment protein p12 family protein [Azotobacter beijerinckii]SER12763.1 Virus attachment protein p12 family protein [Azotobacter beijerinckii]SFB53174.1 Virus attachment protein p12 family protein [Azotobacter beijerinckii]